VLIIYGDKGQVIVVCEVCGHWFEIGHDTVGLEFFEDLPAHRLELLVAFRESSQIIGEGFDDRDSVVQTGNARPFALEHIEVVFEILIAPIVTDDFHGMSEPLQVSDHFSGP